MSKETRWIVSPAYDLTFFIGSVVVSFAFYGLFVFVDRFTQLDSIATILVLRGIFYHGLDQPHIWQTTARVYADEGQFAKIRSMATWGLAAITAGMIAIKYFKLTTFFLLFFNLFGSYHIIRQNMGFMKAYRRLNGETGGERFDLIVYAVVMGGCILRNQAGSDMRLPNSRWADTPPLLPDAIIPFCLATVALAAALFVVVNLRKALRGESLNWPKLLLMSATGLTQFATFFAIRPPGLGLVMETAYHDVQYHAWMARYQKLKFHMSRFNWQKWLLAAAAFGAFSLAVEYFPKPVRPYLHHVLLGFILFHYIIDGYIWKFSEDKELSKMFFSRKADAAPVPSTPELRSPSDSAVSL